MSAVLKPIDGLSITPSFFYQKLTLGRSALHRQRSGHRRALPTVRRAGELLGRDSSSRSLNITYTTPILGSPRSPPIGRGHEPLNQDTTESWTTGLGPMYVTGYDPPGRNRRVLRDRVQPLRIRPPRSCASPRSGTPVSNGWSATTTRTSIRPGTSYFRRRTGRRCSGRTTCSATSARCRFTSNPCSVK